MVDAEKSATKLLKSTLVTVPKRAHAATIDVPIRATAYGLQKSLSGLKLIKDDGGDMLDSVIKHATYNTFENSRGRSGENSSDGEHEEEPSDDLAKSKYMMKNIANLLTTASIYTGLDNAENINELLTDMGNDNDPDDSDETETRPSNASVDITPYSLNSRKPTLFEISVTPKSLTPPNIDQDSLARAKKVSLKLQERFQLKEDDKLIYECTAWVLKDALIQGRIFLTRYHLLFYALLPKNSDDKITMTGNLNVKSRLKGITRYWCILNGATLSLYTSPSDIYFPVITIDLRNVTRIEINESADNKKFTLTTNNNHKFTFLADSKNSAQTWFKALKRQRFTVDYSSNNALKLVIPLSNLLYIDDETIVREALTLSIRVLETSDSYVMDDYLFMFLDKNGYELKNILFDHLKELKSSGHPVMFDEEETPELLSSRTEELPSNSYYHTTSDEGSRKPRISRLKRLRSKSHTWLHRSHDKCQNVEESLIIESHFNKTSSDDIGASFLQNSTDSPEGNAMSDNSRRSPRKERLVSWTINSLKNVTEMWNAKPLHYHNPIYTFDDSMPLISGATCTNDNGKFRKHFNLPENQYLIASYFTFLNRNVPTYGKLYIGTESICFRSLLPGSNTIMILPHTDIQSCYTERGVRLGYYILVIVIDSHNELFFEFSSESTRNDSMKIVTYITRELQTNLDLSTVSSAPQNRSTPKFIENDPEHAKLKFFEDKISQTGINVPLIFDHNPYYTTHIKPTKAYNIACLTIGSRGDVQPYIAFGLGLMKEGHHVTIITHKEFREFVTSHGIKFKEIAGNPAELMSLMVEHESMNIGLLKDASNKFSGWITELLDSSWLACKDEAFDILIESPSAMAGIHIAEALNIAYFRAFTMPWTRTRAYPHAFIVPDQKRGGNYNYLTHVLFENIFWKGIGGQVNKWRVECLHLQKTNLDMLQQNKVPFLYNVSPTIFPPSVDFNEWVKVTGYWFLDDKVNYEPPKELVNFIAEAKKKNKHLVYVGFGSIVVSNAREMTKALIEAVLEADVYCVLNKGWSSRLGDTSSAEIDVQLPPSIYNAGAVPHDWLFPQMDATVHHGGSGTVGASLRFGLPTVVKPFFGDQFFYANQIQDIGVGICLKKLNMKSLAAALKRVTIDEKMKERAKYIQSQVGKEDGVQTAIGCIYSELEYARSLINEKYNRNKLSEPETSKSLIHLEKFTNRGLTDVSEHVASVVSSFKSLETPLEDSWVLL